ncbi:MAG: hypothetical protein ACPL7K_07545, partial [Armatimonadota bacterium]
MSYEIGMNAIRLIPSERLGHTEYCSNYALIHAVTGLDPQTDPEAGHKFHELWQYDFLWVVNDGPVDWGSKGRV